MSENSTDYTVDVDFCRDWADLLRNELDLMGCPAENDGLLNDWGIHHFHIGEIDKQSGKVSRTGPLLYALVKDDHFYMIDVMSHKDFSTQRLLDIIYSNWPDVIEGHEIKGALGLDYVCNDEESARLRKHGISTLTMRSEGAVHLPVGGGITTSKSSVNVVRQSKKCLQALMAAERLLKRDAGEIAQSAINKGYAVGSKLSFVLRMEDNLFFGVEKSSGVAVHLPGLEKILWCRTPELT